MSIGVALAEARGQAGLSVTEVSDRTRIRAAIIRDIERDDYAACGGDFYARGHIRAIAKVVGTDPVPLIAEYDAALLPPEDPEDPEGLADADLARGANGRVRAGLPPAGRGPAQRGADAEPLRRPAASGSGLSAGGGRFTRGGQWRPPWTATVALTLLAVIGLLIYLLISGSARGSGAVAGHHHGGTNASRPDAGKSPAAGSTASPGPSAASAAAPKTVGLAAVSITAFGPGGSSQGDDPQGASLAINGSAGNAWHTDWYTTPDFGRLQSGTGLLLDMGHPVTVSGATIMLGSGPGGALQLRAGNAPALASLPPVAQAADASGAVTLRVSHPVRARYLLVWLTRLPPDNSGTYEALVYHIAVRGLP